MRKETVIYGAGGLGREILSLVSALPEWEVVGFFDDGLPKDSFVKNLPVLGGLQALTSNEYALQVILAIGDPAVKARLAEKLAGSPLLKFPTLVHPQALLQEQSVVMGRGCVITAGVILTTDVRLGDHVLLNLNTTIGHDVYIGDCTSVMPGVNIAGQVRIGRQVLIGSGANILNGLTIGDGARIGSGAVVTKDVAAGDTVVGVPAVPITKSN